MTRFRMALAVFFVLILTLGFGCSGERDSAKGLAKGLSGDFSCRLNIQSNAGELLFGGTLSKSKDVYLYALDYPEQIKGTCYRLAYEDVFLETGGLYIKQTDKNCKIRTAVSILREGASSVKANSERIELYGISCTKNKLPSGDLCFTGTRPLALIWDGARAEITGFTYGKDDNFGHHDKESVA